MGRGLKLFTVSGIRINADYSWFIVFVVFAWSLASGYFPTRYPGLGRGDYALMGLVSSFLLFACILAHELAHSITAKRLGVGIRSITLFIFGGVADLEGEPGDPGAELKIALAGPAASALMAAAFYALSLALPDGAPQALKGVVAYLATINAVVLLFNMIPGFPLDGGRVLRAAWWKWTGDQTAATRAASIGGRWFAIFLIATGVIQLFSGGFVGGVWSILIGVFILQAAESGYRQQLFKSALEGVKVRDAMTRSPVAVEADLTLLEAVNECFLVHHHAGFPVVSDGKVVGILTLAAVKRVDKGAWPSTTVAEAMFKVSAGQMLSPGDDVMEAAVKLSESEPGRLPVVEGGAMVGIITRSDIMRLLELRGVLKGR